MRIRTEFKKINFSVGYKIVWGLNKKDDYWRLAIGAAAVRYQWAYTELTTRKKEAWMNGKVVNKTS
ncbi:MAG: hypothetical protein JST58_07110 [Bacteroidetes bacterium]|nr:hypothetical protein [Bacteroidota bacterium]